mmetsp:Transcript_13299/g.1944  ORF Transcript_13299/g.1944 Transcript_13299/m.1944 type:complete len:81 (+) Transcript_13299:390-632(+)
MKPRYNQPLVDSLESELKLYLRYYGQKSKTFLMRLNNLNEYVSKVLNTEFKDLKETTLPANQDLNKWNNNKMTWKTYKYN